MKNTSISCLITVAIIFLMISGCSNSGTGSDVCTPVATSPYSFDLPDHFPQFIVSNNNLTTEEGVALGKRLYYDKMLSEGGPLEGRACASCHIQKNGFTSNSSGTAVLPHTNLAWSSHFLWNGKISGSLEDIMDFEIADFFKANVNLFRADPTYQRMNCKAFGTSDLSRTDMANAMAQWMRTLVSSKSKYDRYLASEVELSELESRGQIIFTTNIGDCFKCHTLPLTTDLLFHNNGLLDFNPTREFDLGRFNITGDPKDKGRFKTPTLRNIALTAPYMHDGRFQTLEEVVEHYNSGVHSTITLDPVMQTLNNNYGLGLSDLNKQALVAFLNTFTDTAFTTDPEFSDPF